MSRGLSLVDLSALWLPHLYMNYVWQEHKVKQETLEQARAQGERGLEASSFDYKICQAILFVLHSLHTNCFDFKMCFQCFDNFGILFRLAKGPQKVCQRQEK